MTWRVLISAPYLVPAIEEFRGRLEAAGVEVQGSRWDERSLPLSTRDADVATAMQP